MGGFFGLLIGYFVFLITSYYNAYKEEKPNIDARNERHQYAIKYNRPVWFYGYRKDKQIHLDTKTNREVFLGTDVNGLKRWYYSDTKRPMLYSEDKRIMNSLETNKTLAVLNEEKSCVAEYFWDNSVIDLEDLTSSGLAYLDDLGIDNRLSQRVYLKNMRPYQLYLIGDTKTGADYLPLIKRQYLIRFGNTEYFNYKTQHCISDKRIGAVKAFWTKWYAIIEKEFFDLIDSNKREECLESTKTLFDLNHLEKINMKDVAFDEGVKEINWDLNNCGIIRAFDNDGNFIEDLK